MVGDERSPIDGHRLAARVDPVGHPVPGSQPEAGVAQDDDAGEQLGPAVEVLLVGVAVALEAVVAPLEAAFAPPGEALAGVGVVAEEQDAHVVLAVRLLVGQLRREAVFHDPDRALAELGDAGRGLREEHDVGIDVEEQVDLGMGAEQVTAPRGGEREEVFDEAAIGLRRQQVGVGLLEIGQGYGSDLRVVELSQDAGDVLVEAEDPEGELADRAFERVVQDQPAREVVGVEVRAEVDHRPAPLHQSAIASVTRVARSTPSSGNIGRLTTSRAAASDRARPEGPAGTSR